MPGHTGAVERGHNRHAHRLPSGGSLAESRDRATQIVRNVQPETAAYPYVRERVRVLGASADSDLRAYYAALRESRALTPGQQYGEALARLHGAGYGLCSDCEGEIGYARLKASPTATRCTACQTVRERTYAHAATPTL